MFRSLFIAALSLLASVIAVPAVAQTFPLTIAHKFGATVIPQKPERIASLDYAGGADDLLALGVQPVTIRYWYGDYPRAVWPWADPLLESEPAILKGDLDFEQIAATEPDVIIAIASGISEADYNKLSLIAPVVAVPEGMGDYALPWNERAMLAGRAIGRQDEAKAQVDAIRAQMAEIAAAHPDWQNKTAVTAYAWGDATTPGAYTSWDVRAQVLEDLGFRTPDAVNALVADSHDFYAFLSPEDLSPIDADLLVWVTSDNWDAVSGLKARPFLNATREGRDVFVGPELTGAFSFASLVSLPFVVDAMVPMIEAALDGDPATHADERPEGL